MSFGSFLRVPISPPSPAWMQLTGVIDSDLRPIIEDPLRPGRFVGKARIAVGLSDSIDQVVNRSKVGSKRVVTAGSLNGLVGVAAQVSNGISQDSLEDIKRTELRHLCLWKKDGQLTNVRSLETLSSFFVRGTSLILNLEDETALVLRFSKFGDAKRLAKVVAYSSEPSVIKRRETNPSHQTTLQVNPGTMERNKVDGVRQIGPASQVSIDIYENEDGPILESYLEQYHADDPYIHFCINLNGTDTIVCVLGSQPNANTITTRLQIIIHHGTIDFELYNWENAGANQAYHQKPPPGSSIGARGEPFIGSMGFYIKSYDNVDDCYFITCAHNFSSGDPEKDPNHPPEYLNMSLPSGTPILQPAMEDLKREVKKWEAEINHYRGSITKAKIGYRIKAQQIAEGMLLETEEKVKNLLSLQYGTAQEIGNLTDMYELCEDQGILWDYALVKVKPERVGSNIIGDIKVTEIEGIGRGSSDREHEYIKMGRTSHKSMGRFLPVTATFSSHPRFPGSKFRMPIIVASSHSRGFAEVWAEKGDSGGPVINMHAAVGIVLGKVTLDPPYQYLEVGICLSMDLIIQRLKDKYGLEFDLKEQID